MSVENWLSDPMIGSDRVANMAECGVVLFNNSDN